MCVGGHCLLITLHRVSLLTLSALPAFRSSAAALSSGALVLSVLFGWYFNLFQRFLALSIVRNTFLIVRNSEASIESLVGHLPRYI